MSIYMVPREVSLGIKDIQAFQPFCTVHLKSSYQILKYAVRNMFLLDLILPK